MPKKYSQPKLFLILICLAASFPFTVAAHTEAQSRDETTAELVATIIEPDIFTAGEETLISLEIKNHDTGEPVTDLKIEIAVAETESKRVKFSGLANETEDVYQFKYTFPAPGEYLINANFRYQDADEQFDFEIFVSEGMPEKTSITTIAIVAVASLIILFLIVLAIVKKNPKIAILGAIITLIAAGLAYSLAMALKSDPSLGIVTCTSSGTCFWTAHVHAYVPIRLCGEEYRLAIETGPLDGPHTHEEKNIIHWHDRLPYDATTKSITKTEPLTLGAFFDALKLNFDKATIDGKKNGDFCDPGKPGTLKMFVNGKADNQFRDYLWQNKDVIMLVFDEKNAEEIEAELLNQPVTFPKLGRG